MHIGFSRGDTGYSQDFADTRRHFAPRGKTPQNGGGFRYRAGAVGACLPRWFMQLQHVDFERGGASCI